MNENRKTASFIAEDNDAKTNGRTRSSNSKSKAHGKPRKKSRSRKDQDIMDDKMGGKKVNDIKWWFKNKELFEQSAQLSFQSITGNYLLQGYPANTMIVPLNPCPGVTNVHVSGGSHQNVEAAINMNGLKLYQQLSMHSGRTATYAPQDVTTMILALGELLSLQEHIRRAFGLACVYNERNWSVPERLLERMGFDTSDLFSNLASYRMRFNTDITRINALPIIAKCPYLEKCVELYSSIYTDGTSPMSAVWAYVPYTTWILDEITYSGGTILKTTPVYKTAMGSGSQNMSYYLSQLELMIDAMFNSSTLQVVYSDILNLSTKNDLNLLKIDYCFETYQVMPVYSEEANLQLRHSVGMWEPNFATFDTSLGITPSNDVYPDPNNNRLFYAPAWSHAILDSGKMNKSHSLIMNFYDTGDPTLAAKIEASRFMAGFVGTYMTDSSSVDWAVDPVLPDHYVVTYRTYAGNNTSTSTTASFTTLEWSVASAQAYLNIILDWEQIDCHPTLYFYNVDASLIQRYFSDLDFYTIVDLDYVRRVNQLTQLTLFDFTNK